MSVFDLGRLISIDEQTIGFKGHHAGKMRISYKKEGDGFQCDAICCDGFTYSFFMRNMPAHKKYLDKGLSPLHARCLFLPDQLKDEHHVCGVDNLYTSARFSCEAFTGKNKVLCHGVARKSGRGVPKCVIQEEPKKKTQQDQMRGTTKAVVLTDDPKSQDFVALVFMTLSQFSSYQWHALVSSGLKKGKRFSRKRQAVMLAWPFSGQK